MIRHLDPRLGPPGELAAAVAGQVRREFAAALDPFLLHAPQPDVMAAVWACFRETMLVPGRLPRTAKEALATAVSHANRCRYCVDAHGFALQVLGAGAFDRALAAGRPEAIADPRAAAAAAWALASRSPEAPSVARPPFAAGELPEALGAATCFHYINRMATVFLGPTPLPSALAVLRRPLMILGAPRFRGLFRRPLAPGEAPGLPASPAVPRHLAWAAGAPEIARAFAALDAAVARATAGVLCAAGRSAVMTALAGWQGEDPPFGGGWLDVALAEVGPPASRAASRLALLVALAPHRVVEGEVAAFRVHHPGDPALVGVASWAAFQAARRISEWLVPAGVSG